MSDKLVQDLKPGDRIIVEDHLTVTVSDVKPWLMDAVAIHTNRGSLYEKNWHRIEIAD